MKMNSTLVFAVKLQVKYFIWFVPVHNNTYPPSQGLAGFVKVVGEVQIKSMWFIVLCFSKLVKSYSGI